MPTSSQSPGLIAALPATLRSALLAGCEIVSYHDGETVVRAGETDDAYYLIMSGQAEVFSPSGELLRTMGPGDGFGELALLLHRSRTATVAALGPLVCSRLTAAQFRLLIADRENLLAVTSTLAARHADGLSRLEETIRRQERAYWETLRMLAAAAEARVPHLRGHAERCGRLCRRLAAELGLTPEEQEQAELTGLLHEVGGWVVPDAVWSRPEPLDAADEALLRQHPLLGAEAVERVEHLAPIAAAIHGHHERWDGAGYPDGLAGEAIPLGAQIVAVADVFDALVTARPARAAQPWTRAVAVIAAARGRQLAPRAVEALLGLARRGVLV